MKKVLVPLAPGFEEIETVTVVDILRRAGARVVLAATEEGPIEGSRGISVVPDTLIDQVDDRDFDLVVRAFGLLRIHSSSFFISFSALPTSVSNTASRSTFFSK